MSLHNKSALITGAAGGLGRVLTDMYLSRGANVTICDVNASRLAEAREAYAESHPGRVAALDVDVTDEDSVRSLVETAVEQFGGVDFVVNNAGIMDRFDAAGECDTELWNRVLAVNLTGPFLVTKHAVSHMKKAPTDEDEGNGEGVEGGKGGLIINIASNSSLRGLAAGVAYTASKHGLLALTKNTAGAYRSRGVYCVALVLGAMDGTNLAEAFGEGGSKLNSEGVRLMQEVLPGYRSVPMADVARYVGFLSEGMGESANGSCITLNGNWPEA